ncbi:hypothetical protein [Sinorhizobium medicae]|uniref:hypothetical protein n=1 Tax=Sinorhizobium medicae TaxID=110321 RepID=UPI000FD89BB7|nr:hypothetical protein [Sinorhizobium medicae]MQX94795.1 hypothetical protein [Sinorhizobium medicae]RVO78960.1 hypothetical protein CN084_11725 [Sinorhizobium medicae]
MDKQQKLEELVNSMSEEEMRARAEAYTIGQLKIMQSAIQALIAVSPNPEYIRAHIASAFAALREKAPAHPDLTWAPNAIADGAQPVAEAFLGACDANRGIKR